MNLEESIIKLYSIIKNKLTIELSINDSTIFEKENEFFDMTDPTQMIEYLQMMIENLTFSKNETKENQETEEEINPYEVCLRQLEAEIRNHVKIEHQLKLNCESLEEKINELTKSRDEWKSKYKKFQKENSCKSSVNSVEDEHKSKEIENFKLQNEKMKEIVKENKELEIKINEYQNIIKNMNSQITNQSNLEENYIKIIQDLKKKLREPQEINTKKDNNESNENKIKLERKIEPNKNKIQQYSETPLLSTIRTVSCTERIAKDQDKSMKVGKLYEFQDYSKDNVHRKAPSDFINIKSNSTIKRNVNTKSLHSVMSTDMLKISNEGKYVVSKSHTKLMKAPMAMKNSLSRNNSQSKSKINKNLFNYNNQLKNNCEIMIRQNMSNCINNFNIYTNSTATNFRTNDIRFKQYLFNKNHNKDKTNTSKK